jgi:hypothetical protein
LVLPALAKPFPTVGLQLLAQAALLEPQLARPPGCCCHRPFGTLPAAELAAREVNERPGFCKKPGLSSLFCSTCFLFPELVFYHRGRF